MNARAARPHHLGVLRFPIAGARCLALATEASGGGAALHNNTLIEGGPPLRAAFRGVIQAGSASTSREG